MDYPTCFNTYNNVNYRQRSQTMQPTRGSASGDLDYAKKFILTKYLESQIDSGDSERANYANVPQDSHTVSRPHQHVHTRSLSQHHYYHTMRHQDFNNYYNISNVPTGTTIVPARSRHPSPINEPPAMHNHMGHMDSITLFQICNELFPLDSPPPMPNSRNYTILGSKECCPLYKAPFPQRRFTRGHFTDPQTGISLAPNSPVSVLGPSKEDRSKFTVCYNDQHIDIPHQLTQAPEPVHWG